MLIFKNNIIMSISSQRLRVLVIEDNADDYTILVNHLKEEFIYSEIYNAGTFAEAKDFLKQDHNIQIILLDLSLPDEEGEILITSILQLAGNIPVIVLTGNADKGFGIKTLSLGVADYLFKDGLTGIQLYKSIVHSIERNRIHVKLNESEEKYKKLFNLSPLPHWVYDTETLQFLNVNEAAILHYGYSREEFISMTIKDIRSLENIGILNDIIENDVKQGQFNKSLVWHFKKNGELIFVKVESNSIVFEDKNARLVLALDITESIKAQQSLKESEHRFKALVQEGSDLIGILDETGLYKYISPSTGTILGIKPEYLIGKTVFNYVHEDDIEKVIDGFKALKILKRVELSPFRFRDGNNQYRWIESIITNMTDDPVIAGIVTNSRDVTSRMESENRIKESIERYTTVSKATSDIIYEWDFSTNIVKWNKGISGILGYKHVSDTSLDWWYSNVHPEDVKRISNNVQASIKNKKKRWRGEYRFRCENGNYKYVLDRSFVIYNNEDEPVKMIGAMQDITEPVKYIKKIEAQNLKLKEIAWTQSHMVRAPLARIMGLIGILKDHPNQKENLSELLEYILTSASELDEVITSIVNQAADSKQESEKSKD